MSSAPEMLRGVRVLLVDDDEDTCELYTMVLEGAGAEVRTATDAAGALIAITTWTPTLLVSDLSMPEVDGLAFVRKVRSLPNLADTPAVAVTGRTSDEDRERALAAGFQDLVAKPLGPADLVAVVARWTAR